MAILEAKREGLPAEHGLHDPFVFSSNGHPFVEYDANTEMVSGPRLLSEFPSPQDLMLRYCQARGLPCNPAKATEKIWYYDLSDLKLGRKTPLTSRHFDEFLQLHPYPWR